MKPKKMNNQMYVSASRLTMYSSVVMESYFASFPGP